MAEHDSASLSPPPIPHCSSAWLPPPEAVFFQAEQLFSLGSDPTGVLTAADKKFGHTLKPEAWVTTCSLRRTIWIAMSVPVDGEAKGDSEGMASCLVNTMTGVLCK